MNPKKIILLLALLVTGIFSLWQMNGNAEFPVSAHAPVAAPRANPVPIYLPLVIKNPTDAMPVWRFGAGKVLRAITEYDPYQVKLLRLGWYTDWSVTPTAPQPYGIEYVPTIRLKQWKQYDALTWTTMCVTCPYVSPYTYTVSPDRSAIQSFAAARPGMTWIIGNEIERVDWNGGRQDEMLPEVYAVAYNELYSLIKNADATAQIAIGGVIQGTPLRLQYLDRVWNNLTQPVDVWNIHAFVLREEMNAWGAEIPAGLSGPGILYSIDDNKNFTIATGHLVAMRTWMNSKGQRNKPLWITEYGVNLAEWWTGFSAPEVRDSFMYPSFNYFLNQTDANLGYPADGNRLVQRWNWYSLDDSTGVWEQGVYYTNFNGRLFYSGMGDQPQGLAPLGAYWQQYVSALPIGSGKPYAPASAAPITTARAPVPVQAALAVPCDPTRRVRLLFVDPSPPGSSSGFINQRVRTPVAPPVARESALCLPQ